MRRRRHRTTALTITLTLLASLLVHLVLWPIGDRVLSLQWSGPPIPLTLGVIEVALLGDEDTEKDRETLVQEEEKEETEPPGKLVNLDRLQHERPPEKTEYVSEFDNTVDRETRAPNQRPRPGDAPQKPGDAPDANQANPTSWPRSPNEVQALALGERTGATTDGTGLQAEQMPVDESAEGVLPRDPGQAGSPGKQGLRGLPDAVRRAFGSPGSFDDIDGVEEGDENLLNSRRWRFASFFNRVRDAVAQHWHPEVIHAARDPDGRVYGTKTRITRLRIRLNPDGSLHRIRLEQPSGVDYLDEEAIRAVRTAQPFANPPPQLVDPRTGYIDFGFGFIFEIHGAPRIFRYRN